MKELTDMSQQDIDYGESQRERPATSYTGYEGVPHYNDYSTNAHGQKLSWREASRIPTAAQRLALAIVSLVLWIALFLIIAGIMASYRPSFGPGGFESISNTLDPFLIVGFLMFSAIVILVNVLFNRKR
jgi:polyferredoxin